MGWEEEFAALVPCYDENGGNATLIYSAGGAVEADRRSVKANLRRLARFYQVDLEAARRRYGQYLGRAQGVPLPFSLSLVLVPVKMRVPVGKNDGADGYVNPGAVQGCLEADPGEEPVRSFLLLKGGHRLPCYLKADTVNRRLKTGLLVHDHYRREVALKGDPPYWSLLERILELVIKKGSSNGRAP